jgi:uncharacterized membrane-anchored protein
MQISIFSLLAVIYSWLATRWIINGLTVTALVALAASASLYALHIRYEREDRFR